MVSDLLVLETELCIQTFTFSEVPFSKIFLVNKWWMTIATETLFQSPFSKYVWVLTGFPGGLVVKHPPAKQETWVWSLGWEDSLEKEMATHSSTLAWKITWMEEPGRLHSVGFPKSWTWLSNFTLLHFNLQREI